MAKFMDVQTASLQSKSCRNTFESSLCMYIHVYIFFLCFFIYLFIHFFLRLLNIDLTLCKEIYNRVPECKVANLALQYKHSANANKDATKIPRERKRKEDENTFLIMLSKEHIVSSISATSIRSSPFFHVHLDHPP